MANFRTRPIKIVESYIKDLNKTLKIERVIIFGSASRGKMKKDSDIDIIVLSPDFRKMDFIERLTFLTHHRKGIVRKIPMDIIGYTSKEFERFSKQSVVLSEAKKEGLALEP